MRVGFNIFLILYLVLSINSQAQEIEMGTVFIIEFGDSEKLDFKITYQKPLRFYMDSEFNLDSIFQDKPKENQIFGVFGLGKFGESLSSILVLKSGVDGFLDYDLKINYSGRRKFEKTSTMPIGKGVMAKEIWPDYLRKIKFTRFNRLAQKYFDDFDAEFEIKIDSTCLKNPEWNLENGKKEFENYLERIVTEFKKDGDIPLQKFLDYEKEIKSIDATKGHLWGLGESIYPNEKKFKFDIPITYKRIECPYFEVSRSYFYTKKTEAVKVVDFDWITLKHWEYGFDSPPEDLKKEYSNKLLFLEQAVSNLLGEPYMNLTEEDGRRQIKWKSSEGVRAYLFNFSNHSSVRLYIYKD